MKRRRCTTCHHTTKGHKRAKCLLTATLTLSDGSTYVGSTYQDIPSGHGQQTMLNKTVYVGDFRGGVRCGQGTLTTTLFTYIGQWLNNQFQGPGQLSYRNGDIFEGLFENGVRQGVGSYTQTPTRWYRGEWHQNLRHGTGTASSSLGVYQGLFVRDKRRGQGVMTYNDGSVYDGAWSRNTKNGKGQLTTLHSTYDGQWSNNKFHGYGELTCTNTGTYRGHWKFGMRQLHGCQQYPNDDTYDGHWSRDAKSGQGRLRTLHTTYDGQWSNNKFHGYGEFTCTNTGTYHGHWKFGMRQQQGCQRYPNQDMYDGNWSKDVRGGHGTLIRANGDLYKGLWLHDLQNGYGKLETASYMYEGEWLDGQKDGPGTLTLENEVYDGHWHQGQRHGLFQRGKSRELWVHGRLLVLSTLREAKKQLIHLLLLKDYISACHAATLFPSAVTWKLIVAHDASGALVSTRKDICSFLKKSAWSLFRKRKYTLLKACVNQLPTEVITIAMEEAHFFFDSLTDDFEPNPWIVDNASYSASTREKLLKGLFLGDFGRCNPTDPFTRRRLSASSGTFLCQNLKRAKRLWRGFTHCLDQRVPLKRLAYEYNIVDFEQLLHNARTTNDTSTIRTLMSERDEYINRERSWSLDAAESPPVS